MPSMRGRIFGVKRRQFLIIVSSMSLIVIFLLGMAFGLVSWKDLKPMLIWGVIAVLIVITIAVSGMVFQRSRYQQRRRDNIRLASVRQEAIEAQIDTIRTHGNNVYTLTPEGADAMSRQNSRQPTIVITKPPEDSITAAAAAAGGIGLDGQLCTAGSSVSGSNVTIATASATSTEAHTIGIELDLGTASASSLVISDVDAMEITPVPTASSSTSSPAPQSPPRPAWIINEAADAANRPAAVENSPKMGHSPRYISPEAEEAPLGMNGNEEEHFEFPARGPERDAADWRVRALHEAAFGRFRR